MTSERPSFPRLAARTLRFTLGLPRTFRVAPDGSRVVFLRSQTGTDRITCLWVLDLPRDGQPAERLVVDPRELHSVGEERLSPEERARRERAREGAGGVVSYATDRDVRRAVFTLSGVAYVADLVTGETRQLDAVPPVVEPRLDPTGHRVAYVSGGALRVIAADGAADRVLAEPDGDNVTWGLAEFIASEEMGRFRGFWWSPTGDALLAARVDTTPVQRWHIGDPAQPGSAPAPIPYPSAGTANAEVSLALLGLDGTRLAVRWDAEAYPYLVDVHWSSYGPPLLFVQSRDQRRTQVLAVDGDAGRTSVVREDEDPVWVEITPGVPQWAPDGRLVHVADSGGVRRLLLGEAVVSGDLQVRGVADVDEDGVLFTASAADPTEVHVFNATTDDVEPVSSERGVHSATRGGDVTVLLSAVPDRHGRETYVVRGDFPSELTEAARIASCAETPPLVPSPVFMSSGTRGIRTAILLPTDYVPGSGRLPVLLDPYGGPHAQRVVAARSAFYEPQWWADQGFAVVVADGRGTPGRGPEWEKTVALDLATPPLEDQVEAVHAAASSYPDLDLSRVAIRGWSFGGYLAALAVLRRPDVFHAAIAGAPVTDWRLYDTHYTERYLGHPEENPDAYESSSLLADAAKLERPLLLIHGLADDNVVAAHTLQFSSALLAAGRPHTVLPLSGVTHMTPQEVVAENLLLLQLDFLRRALA